MRQFLKRAAGSKHQKGSGYYILWNTKENVWLEGNKQYHIRLPKFLWSRL